MIRIMHIADTPVHTYIHMAITIAIIIYSPILVMIMIMTIIVLIAILMMITKTIIIYPQPNYIPACKNRFKLSILISHCKNIISYISHILRCIWNSEINLRLIARCFSFLKAKCIEIANKRLKFMNRILNKPLNKFQNTTKHTGTDLKKGGLQA